MIALEDITAWAPQIQLVLADSIPFTTLTGSTPTSSFSSSTKSVLAYTTAADLPPGNEDTGDSGRDSGLHTGAIVGIVVGVLGFVLLVVGFVLHRRHKRRRPASLAPFGTDQPDGSSLPELMTGDAPTFGQRQPNEVEPKVPFSAGMAMSHAASEPFELYTPMNMMLNNVSAPRTITSGRTTSEVTSASIGVTTKHGNQEHPPLSSPRTADETTYTYSDKIPVQEELPHQGSTSSPMASEVVVSSAQDSKARLAELEASKAALEERMLRLKHLSQLEEEHLRMQAEIERLRNVG
jgi:hypothetical protein